MPAGRQDRFPQVSRRDAMVIWVVGALVLSPALVAVYAVDQWFAPGTGPGWYAGFVQGVLVPPVIMAMLASCRRWVRRRATD